MAMLAQQISSQGWPKAYPAYMCCHLWSDNRANECNAQYIHSSNVVAKVGTLIGSVDTRNYPFNDTWWYKMRWRKIYGNSCHIFQLTAVSNVDAPHCASDTTLLFRNNLLMWWLMGTAVGNIVPKAIPCTVYTSAQNQAHLSKTVRVERRYNNSVSVYHG